MNPGKKFSLSKLRDAALQVMVLLYFIAVLMINVFPFLGGQFELLDFGSFYASSVNLSEGKNPYSSDSDYVLTIDFPRVGAGGKMINLNPPLSVMAFGVISNRGPYEAVRIWRLTSVVLYVIVLFLLAAAYRQNLTPAKFIWAFTLAALWQTLTLGQIYTFLFLFLAIGWILLQKQRYLLAGLAIGVVVALKPNFLIWPLFLLVSGYTLTFLASVASAFLLSLIPVLFYGMAIYKQWLDASALELRTLILPGNSSLLGLTARFHNIPLGLVLGFLLVCLLMYVSRARTPTEAGQFEYVSALGILAAILASPVAWVGYSMLLLPIFFSLKRWNVMVVLSAAVLTFPFGILLKLWQDSFLYFVIFGWFYGWGLLSLLVGVVRNTIVTSSSQTIWSTSSRKL